MPNAIAPGATLIIQQRAFAANEKTQEVEKFDGTNYIRYQRATNVSVWNAIKRAFADLRDGVHKARGNLCERTKDTMPEHIMLMGCKVTRSPTQTQGAGTRGLASLKVEFRPPDPADTERISAAGKNRAKERVIQTSIQNVRRFKQDMGLQIEFSGNKEALGAMKTFLKFAATSEPFPSRVKGQANIARTTAVINQLVDFKRIFKEVNDQHGIHENDARWVKDKLQELQNKAERISVEGNDKNPDVRNLRALIGMVSDFKTIAVPGEVTRSNTRRDTPVAEASAASMPPAFAPPATTPSPTQVAPLDPPPPSDLPPPLPTTVSTTAVLDSVPQSPAQAVAADSEGRLSTQPPLNTISATVDSADVSDYIPAPPPPPSFATTTSGSPALPASVASVASAPPPPPPPLEPTLFESGKSETAGSVPPSDLKSRLQSVILRKSDLTRESGSPSVQKGDNVASLLLKALEGRRENIAGNDNDAENWDEIEDGKKNNPRDGVDSDET